MFEATVDGRTAAGPPRPGLTALVVLPERTARISPFWSPDSQSIAFFAHGGAQLKRIAADGRTRTVLCRHTVIGAYPSRHMARPA